MLAKTTNVDRFGETPPLHEPTTKSHIRARIMVIDLLNSAQLSKLQNSTISGRVIDVFACPYDGLSQLMEDPKDYAFCLIGESVFRGWRTSKNIRDLIKFEAGQYGVALRFHQGLNSSFLQENKLVS